MRDAVFVVQGAGGCEPVLAVKALQMCLRADADGLRPPERLQLAHGLSDKLLDDYTPAIFVEQLRELMDALHDKVTPLEDALQNLELEEAHQHALALIAFLTDAV